MYNIHIIKSTDQYLSLVLSSYIHKIMGYCGKFTKIIDHEPYNFLVPFTGTKSHKDFLKDTSYYIIWILNFFGSFS